MGEDGITMEDIETTSDIKEKKERLQKNFFPLSLSLLNLFVAYNVSPQWFPSFWNFGSVIKAYNESEPLRCCLENGQTEVPGCFHGLLGVDLLLPPRS